jgi:phosphoglycerol transferase MdoB-like AlkP superfamily enzyme
MVVKSVMALANKQPFGKTDNILSLSLFSATHIQLLVGAILYFVSPYVQFSGAAMKDSSLRYWTTEHNVMMLGAIVLITLARTTSKKMTDDTAKHRRLLIFNSIALALILVAIVMSKRGLFSMPGSAM